MTIQKFQDRLALLHTLQAEDTAVWGVMSAQNVIEHLGGIFYATAVGKGQHLMLPPATAEKAKAKFFSSYYPFPQNVKMPGTQDKPTVAPRLRYNSLEAAKEKMQASAALFLEKMANHPEQTAGHGYFGALNMAEWFHLHIKHMEHHLMQFEKLPSVDPKIPQIEKLLYKLQTQLTADTPAKWGKMNAHQMVEHLGMVFILSTGKFNFTDTVSEEEAAQNWQDFLAAKEPWKTIFQSVTFGEPRPTRKATIEESKASLRQSFQQYLAYCEANPDAVHPHYFTGLRTVDEWRQIHVKHVEHHLRQFGIIE